MGHGVPWTGSHDVSGLTSGRVQRRLDFRIKAHRELRARVFTCCRFECGECGFAPDDPPQGYDGRYAIWAEREGERRYLHLDHVVPLVAGGTDAADNLQVLCEPCNCRKATADRAA
jgi:hypothetical protein